MITLLQYTFLFIMIKLKCSVQFIFYMYRWMKTLFGNSQNGMLNHSVEFKTS